MKYVPWYHHYKFFFSDAIFCQYKSFVFVGKKLSLIDIPTKTFHQLVSHQGFRSVGNYIDDFNSDK